MRLHAPFFILAVFAATALAQGDYINKLMDMMTSDQQIATKNSIMNRILDKIDDTKMTPAMKTKFRNAFMTGDLSSFNSSIIMSSELPKEIFSAIRPEIIFNMGQREVDLFVLFGKNVMDKSFYDWLKQLKETNVTKDQAIAQLQNLLPSSSTTGANEVSRSKIDLLLSRLGDFEDFTADDVKEIKPILFLVDNSQLMKIENEEAQKEILRQSDLCISNGATGEAKAPSCPSSNEVLGRMKSRRADKMMDLRYQAFKEVHGEADELMADDFANMKLEQVPLTYLMEVDGKLLDERLSDLAVLFSTRPDVKAKIGRFLAGKIAKFQKLDMITNAADLESKLRKLGELRDYIQIGDVNINAVSDSMKATLNRNGLLALQEGDFDCRSAKIIAEQSRKYRGSLSATDVQQMGSLVALTDALSIKSAEGANILSANQWKEIADNVEKYGGSSKEGKLRQVKKAIQNTFTNSDGIDMNTVTRTMMKTLPVKDFSTLSPASISAVMSKNIQLPVAATGAMMNRLPIQNVLALTPNGKSHVPIAKVQAKSTNKINLASELPSSSPLAKLAKDEVIGTKEVLRTYDFSARNTKPAIKFFGKNEVDMIHKDDLMDVMEEVKDIPLTREFCYGMKDRLVNESATTKMTKGEYEAMMLLTPLDIENMPPCVVAAFGSENIRSLGMMEKKMLFKNLLKIGHVYNTTGIPREVAEVIIEAGLMANDIDELTSSDYEKMRTLIILSPSSILSTLSMNALPVFFQEINELAMTPIMPCLDNGRLAAIRSLIFKYLGDSPAMWTDISEISCLLYTLNDGDMSSMDSCLLSSVSCKDKKDVNLYKTLVDMLHRECMADGRLQNKMNRERNVERRQDISYLQTLEVPIATTRRKRAVSDIDFCDRAYANGANDISQGELGRLEQKHIENCLVDLCSNNMDMGKAHVIVRKLIETLPSKNITKISRQQLEMLNYCIKGLTKAEIEMLPVFRSPEYYNVVSTFGLCDTIECSMEQKEAAAKKIKDTWKTGLGSWTAPDISLVNQLLCYFPEEDLDKININAIKEALPSISDLNCQNMLKSVSLMKRIASGFGDPKLWSSAVVSEIGSFIKGIDPENLKSIPNTAFSGISPSAMEKIPTQVSKVMTVEQLKNLPGASAAAVTPEQLAQFGEEMRRVLAKTKAGFSHANQAQAVSFCTLIFGVLATFLVFRN